MLSKAEKSALRNDLFRHLDGLVTAPVALLLLQKGVLKHLQEQGKASLGALTDHFQANKGYLNVALRVLSSQGWLDHEVDNTQNEVWYAVNEQSAIAFDLIPLYEDVVNLIHISEKYHRRKFEREPFAVLEKIFHKYRDNYGIAFSEQETVRCIQQQVLKHIEGILIGPTVVALGMGGMFHKYFMEASFRPEEFHKDGESFDRLLDFFAFLDWFKKKNHTYSFTGKRAVLCQKSQRLRRYGILPPDFSPARRTDLW